VEHLRADLVHVTLSQQSGRGAVGELRVQSLEPCLDHFGGIPSIQEVSDLQGSAEPTRGLVGAHFPNTLRPFMNGPRLADARDVRDETRSKKVSQFLDDDIERLARPAETLEIWASRRFEFCHSRASFAGSILSPPESRVNHILDTVRYRQ